MQTRVCILALALAACAGAQERTMTPPPSDESRAGSFANDLAFLTQHTRLIVLQSADGRAQVAVAPEYQGRVMTSTAAGAEGPSYGYVHRAGVERGAPSPHMSVVGGEDRFWLGPEGGDFALYFAPGVPFEFAHWQVPAELDWGAWPVKSQSAHAVTLERDMALVNYHGTELSLHVTRSVRLLDAAAIEAALSRALPVGLSAVAFESDNRVTNTGSAAWHADTGLPSIWILGMFRPAPRAVVVIPVRADAPGPIVNDAYFGSIPRERLRVGEGAVFLRADGRERGKIGVPPARARGWAGSYDPDSRTLTLVQYSAAAADARYVSSTWEHQPDPYAGDVLHSYNDGPTPSGPPLGPFYEIESSSPALALEPGGSAHHVHRTFHLTGEASALDAVANAVLGVSLRDMAGAFGE